MPLSGCVICNYTIVNHNFMQPIEICNEFIWENYGKSDSVIVVLLIWR